MKAGSTTAPQDARKNCEYGKQRRKKIPRKFKEQPSAGKIHGTIFWNYQGVIVIEYSPPGRTMTADTYFDTLMRLQQTIKKRCGLLLEGVVLMHENA